MKKKLKRKKTPKWSESGPRSGTSACDHAGAFWSKHALWKLQKTQLDILAYCSPGSGSFRRTEMMGWYWIGEDDWSCVVFKWVLWYATLTMPRPCTATMTLRHSHWAYGHDPGTRKRLTNFAPTPLWPSSPWNFTRSPLISILTAPKVLKSPFVPHISTLLSCSSRLQQVGAAGL